MQKHKPYQKIKQQRAYRKVLAVVSLAALICVSSVYFALWYETKDAQAQANWVRPEPSAPLSVEEQIREIANEHNFQWVDYLVKLAKCESRLDPFALNSNGNYGIDRGLFQINSKYHKEVNSACAFDIRCSVEWTIKQINEGKQSMWVCDKIIAKNN